MEKETATTKAFYGYEELMNRWGVSRSTVERCVTSGTLAKCKIRRRTRFSHADVEKAERLFHVGRR